jgi:hypothetical protein
MTSCFLKLHTPTRVCEIIIRNWSAGQLVTLKTFVYCAACYAAETSSIASEYYPDIHPITAYLRPIYGSKPRYDRDVTATASYCYTKIKKI